MKLIDAHAHLQFPQFDEDREAVIVRAREAGVGVINVGTDLETSRAAMALAEQNDNIWATVGIHPTDLPSADRLAETFTELESLAKHSKVVGIGECGLDYFHIQGGEERKKQQEIFVKQIGLAKIVNKPLMIHCRDAYQDLFDIIKNDNLIGNIHFFAGDWGLARKFLDLGFFLSFTGVITFARNYDEVLKNAPLDQIMVETDCPFVAPAPYRGKRNEPIYVVEVAKQIAILRNLTPETVAGVTLANTRRLFAL